jgi:hypothetical protein
VKRIKRCKSGGKSKTKGVKTRARGPVDDVDFADEVKKWKESQRNIRVQSQQIRYRRLGMCLRALSEMLKRFLRIQM